MKAGYVYILASRSRVLYTGVTARLAHRTVQHRRQLSPGFASKYEVNRVVYWEHYDRIAVAIAREKQIKGWLRAKKVALIESKNPNWKDLAEEFFPLKKMQLQKPGK
ncbi:MAG TPA: GIY-YIG nuclease family protein [Candidatus Acidoferrales bacterium]